MSYEWQVTRGPEPAVGTAKRRANDDVARATVPWAALRQYRIPSLLKRFRPLVMLVRALQHYGGMLTRPYVTSRYLQTHAISKLQIGSDIWLLPGWLNTDLYPKAVGCITLDATKPFPFSSASFDYVFSEHQMEHVDYTDAANMLRECHRVLRPGGKIRIALPSVDRLLALFAPSPSDLQQKYIAIQSETCYPGAGQPKPCFAINAAFMNWGHRFLYDRLTLESLLQEIGYTNIQFFEVGQSDDPNLNGIEMRTSEIDLYETMVVQAARATV